MAKNATPRAGAKSAPTASASPAPVTFGPGGKSAPSAAPTVRSTKAPLKGGDWQTPTSVKSNQVDQIAPKPGSKDSAIGRTA